MLIYIIHADKIYDFRLPTNVAGKYILTDYDNFNNKRKLINIEAKDNNWYILENKDVKIVSNGQNIESTILKPFCFYNLVIQGIETIMIYTMPALDTTFKTYEVVDNASIIIGSGGKSNIIHTVALDSEHIKISYVNGRFNYIVTSNKCPIFVNKRVATSGFIDNFDTMFVMGLKIIACGNKLLINNPSTFNVTISSNQFKNVEDKIIVPDKKTNVRTFTDFYSGGEYYYKSPVFKSKITPLKLKITDPPSREQKDKSSIMMTVIPMLIMTFSSVIMSISTLSKFLTGETTLSEALPILSTIVSLIILSILWPFIERRYTNHVIARNNRRVSKKYRNYLKTKQKELESSITDQN